MQIIVALHIMREEAGRSYLYTTVKKKYDTSLVPMVGMELEDSAWRESREIKNVTINPTEDNYFIEMSDSAEGEASCKQLADMYSSHGWANLRSSNR